MGECPDVDGGTMLPTLWGAVTSLWIETGDASAQDLSVADKGTTTASSAAALLSGDFKQIKEVLMSVESQCKAPVEWTNCLEMDQSEL